MRIFLPSVQNKNSLDLQRHIYKRSEGLKVISFKNLSSSSRLEEPLCVYTGRAKQSYHFVVQPKYEDGENNDDENDDNTSFTNVILVLHCKYVCFIRSRNY